MGPSMQNQPKTPKKSNTGIIIGIVVGVIILILVLFTILCVQIFKLAEKESQYTEDDYDYEDDYDDDYGDDYSDDDEYDGGYSSDEFENIDWEDETWKETPYNYSASEVGTEYYTEVADCIDTTVPYTITREFYEYYEPENDVCMRIAYYQLAGDIPNLEDINTQLKDYAIYYAEDYKASIADYQDYFAESGAGYIININSYVTYNDTESISIVYDEYYATKESDYYGLYAYNVNLMTGTVLDNTSVLDYSSEMIASFRERNTYQNGADAGLCEDFTDDELKDMFSADESLILFYTPLGLEVGYNYETDSSQGWVTVTIPDYEKFAKSF